MLATDRLELEEIGRQVLLVLHSELNNEIEALQAEWTSRDQEFWGRLGIDRSITVEQVPPENFYVGHVPSLINADIVKYPNCAVYGFQANPRRSEDDHGEFYEVRIAVEVMCKSERDEQEVNSRVHRTVDAAHSALSKEGARELGGFVAGLAGGTPNVTVGEVFVRREDRSRGDRWFWQGGRLEYRLDRFIQY